MSAARRHCLSPLQARPRLRLPVQALRRRGCDASAPAEGSLDAALGKVSAKPFLLVLKDAPAWLSEERPMRFQTGYLDVAAGKAFDAVAYFDRATAAARVTKP